MAIKKKIKIERVDGNYGSFDAEMQVEPNHFIELSRLQKEISFKKHNKDKYGGYLVTCILDINNSGTPNIRFKYLSDEKWKPKV